MPPCPNDSDSDERTSVAKKKLRISDSPLNEMDGLEVATGEAVAPIPSIPASFSSSSNAQNLQQKEDIEMETKKPAFF